VGPDHRPRIEEEAMHPAMEQVLATEHVRDMLVSAAKAQRVGEARHARKAARTMHGAAADAALVVAQPGRRPQCAQSAMEH
jgi:hypothetical protein